MTDLSQLKISTRLIAQEAMSRGWGVELVAPGYSYITITHPRFKEPILLRSTITPMTSYASGSLCDNKWAFHCSLLNKNIPVPDTIYVAYDTFDKKEIGPFLKKHKNVVVKPIDTNHGEGITKDLSNLEAVIEAIEYTKQYSRENGCLVQEQRQGDDYRFLVINGKFAAASGRTPAFITGDGLHSVEELIQQKNNDPMRGEGHTAPLTKINRELVLRYIGHEKLSYRPHKHEIVKLMAVSNLSKGGEAIDITDQVHPELKELACQVANQLGVGVCGVDILTSDPEQSINSGGAVVLEANNSPGIRMHHYPSLGKKRDVASQILDELIFYLEKHERSDYDS